VAKVFLILVSFFRSFFLGSFKCGVGGRRWAPYDRYFSYLAKILEKGCPTWPDNRGCTVHVFLVHAINNVSSL